MGAAKAQAQKITRSGSVVAAVVTAVEIGLVSKPLEAGLYQCWLSLSFEKSEKGAIGVVLVFEGIRGMKLVLAFKVRFGQFIGRLAGRLFWWDSFDCWDEQSSCRFEPLDEDGISPIGGPGKLLRSQLPCPLSNE